MSRLLIAFVAVLALALPAAAQPGPDACVADTKASPDDQVASCTAIIAANASPQDVAAALVQRGLAYEQQGQRAKAQADIERAIALDAGNARAFRARAEIFRRMGEFDKSILDSNEAIRLDPASSRAFNGRGNAFNN